MYTLLIFFLKDIMPDHRPQRQAPFQQISIKLLHINKTYFENIHKMSSSPNIYYQCCQILCNKFSSTRKETGDHPIM